MRGGIITEEDAALLRILAVKGRETVMVPMTEASMTVTLGAGGTWCVAAITASSSATTIMRRTTAARGLLAETLRALLTIPPSHQVKKMEVQGNRILCQYFHWSLHKV